MGKPAYTGVVLKPFDQDFLRQVMSEILDNGLREAGFVEQNARGNRLSHHMTICMGPCPEELRPRLGDKVVLTVDAWGRTDKSLAVRVHPFCLEHAKIPCQNATPHVTVAVNPGNSGSPKDSNGITEWTAFDQTIGLNGVLEEVCH